MMKRTASYLIMALAVVAWWASASAAAAPSASPSAAAASRPTLAVGIVVDQLRTDELEHLQGAFRDRGFRLLMDSALYLRSVESGIALPDPVNTTVMLMTGEYPSRNGVPSERIYDPARRLSADALTDAAGKPSPEAIRVTTLADEVQVDGDNLCVVYAVAPTPGQAVALAGHAGTGAVWLDENTGKWTGSAWYKSLPPCINARNHNRSLAARLDTMTWRPLLRDEQFVGIPRQHKYYPFSYTFPRGDRDVYRMFAATPLMNSEVTDVAIDLLTTAKMGRRTDGGIDMLNVAYTLAPYPRSTSSDLRMERQDAYVRLDVDLERLFSAIDREVGLQNALVFLTSTGYATEPVRSGEAFRLPGGEVSVKRTLSLLGAYLTAKFGNGDYVETMEGNFLCLNKKGIEARRLDYQAVAAEARDFLSRVSGVGDVYTLRELTQASTPDMDPLRRSIDPSTAADLYVATLPGWRLVDDRGGVAPTTPAVRLAPHATPAFVLAPGISAQSVAEGVAATSLAPTVAAALRVRLPEGARSAPLRY